jgi:hypothetical protein
MLTKTLFAKWMTTLHKRFSKDADQHVVELYYEHLSQLSDAEFETAAKSIFTNDEFWPAPKRFIDLARGTTKDAANREWALLIDACTRNNTNPPLSPSRHHRHAPRWRLARNRLRRRPQQTRTTQAPLYRRIRNRRATTPTRPTPKQQPPATLMNITYNDNRLILGDPNTTCSNCHAPAIVKYAGNGKAEIWHAPTTCCNYAINRERRFARLTQIERDRDGDHE